MAYSQAPELASNTPRSVEVSKLIVRQPPKLKELSQILETLDNLSARVGEHTSEDRSGDWSGGAGGATGQGQGQGDDGVSPRDQAIQNMPPPLVVRQRLEQHIEKEVSKLEREARWAAKSGKPGTAFRVNELYSRIRKLNALLASILEAAEEILKRLFIRVFIDKQPII